MNLHEIIVNTALPRIRLYSLIEKFSDNIIKICTQLDTLSYIELGFIISNLCLFILLLMSIALIVFFVRSKLIKLLITKNQWIPQPIFRFFNTRFLQDNVTLPSLFYAYYILINLVAICHLHSIISGFMISVSSVTTEVDFYFARSLKSIWVLYTIILLMIIEIFKARFTALRNIKMPIKIRIYLETPLSIAYVLFLILCLLAIVNYLDWIFITILEPGLSLYDDPYQK